MESQKTAFSVPEEPQARHLRVGREGERTALRFLQGCGCDIRAKNVRVGRDEIDIVAFDPQDDVLVFCEVKARRRHHADYSPLLACTHGKRRKMFRAARAYVAQVGWEGGYRLDWLLVEQNTVIDHVRDIVSEGLA